MLEHSLPLPSIAIICMVAILLTLPALGAAGRLNLWLKAMNLRRKIWQLRRKNLALVANIREERNATRRTKTQEAAEAAAKQPRP